MKKLMLASVVCAVSLCGIAATYTITDFANHASANDALRVKTGDTIKLPTLEDGSYQAVNTRILQIDGNVATVLMPGIVGIQQLDGSGALVAVAAVLSVPDPIADGRVCLLKEFRNGADGNASWTASDWIDLTESLEGVAGSCPNAANDIAILANYNGDGYGFGVQSDITLGGLMVGAYRFDKGMENCKYWIRGSQGSVTNTLTFARSDGESPWIQLCPGANLVEQNLNFLGFGYSYDKQVEEFPVGVKCIGDVICDLGWDGVDPASCHSRLIFGKDSTLTIPEDSSLTFVNASPQARGACDATINCLGVLSGAGRLVNNARAAIEINFDATDFTGVVVESSAARTNYDRDGNIWIHNSDTFQNATFEINGFAARGEKDSFKNYDKSISAGFLRVGYWHDYSGQKPVGNRLPGKELVLNGGFVELYGERKLDGTWEAGSVIRYETDKLTVDHGWTRLLTWGPEVSATSLPPVRFAAQTVSHPHDGVLVLSDNGLWTNHSGYSDKMQFYVPWFSSQAINGIVPWIVGWVDQPDNGGSGGWRSLRFPVVDGDGYLVSPGYQSEDKKLDEVDSTANVYYNIQNPNDKVRLSADKTINSLVIGSEYYHDHIKFCKELTIASGGLVLSGEVKMGGCSVWNQPLNTVDADLGTIKFGSRAYFFPNIPKAGDENSRSWCMIPIIAPYGFVCGHPGWFTLCGDQTGIDVDFVLNAGELTLGLATKKNGTEFLMPCILDVPVRIVGGGSKLILAAGSHLDSTQNVYFEDIGGFAGKLEIPEGSTETCVKCYVDGVTLPRGTYGATGSGADNIDDDHFAGGGVLKVKKDDLVRGLQIIIL